MRQTVVVLGRQATLSIPKTARGRRSVTLNAQTAQALREHRKQQAAERLQMGAGWQDSDPVIATVEGPPLHPER